MKRLVLIIIAALVTSGFFIFLVNRQYKIGEMTVSSGGIKITAYKSWDHGTRNGLAGDAVQIIARGY